MICGSEFATVLLPVSTTWIVRKLSGLSQEDNKYDPNDWQYFSQRSWKQCCFSHLTYMFPFQNLKNKGLVRHSAPPSFLLPLLKGCRSPYLAVLCSSLPWIFQKNSNDSNDFSCTLRSRNTEEMHNLLHTESSSPSQEIDVA